MKNWIIPAALIGVVSWLWLKSKKTQAATLPGPVIPSGPSGSGILPVTSSQTYVYDKLYFKQSPYQIKGTGQVVRISSAQIQEALSKGYVDALTFTNVFGNPIVDSSTPLDFYSIWSVGEPLP